MLKIIGISDTHCRHNKVKVPKCDILIHAGDHSRFGLQYEFENFINWFATQKADKKIFIPGNHDIFLYKEKEYVENLSKKLGVIFLSDSGVELHGIKFYGFPWTPRWGPWAFMCEENEMNYRVGQIPNNTDVLISHGPPLNHCDYNGKRNVGCKPLLERLKSIKPKLVVCGHIHEGYGVSYSDFGSTIVNVAQLNSFHFIKNNPYNVILWKTS